MGAIIQNVAEEIGMEPEVIDKLRRWLKDAPPRQQCILFRKEVSDIIRMYDEAIDALGKIGGIG